MSRNGHDGSVIPGAPQWVQDFFARVDRRLDVFLEAVDAATTNMNLATGQFNGLRDRVTAVEDRTSKVEAEVVELKEFIRRSLTPPSGFAATLPPEPPPDEAA